MSSVTSLTNPALFAAAPVLPSGFYYQLSNTGQTYQFGQKTPLYFIGIIRQSDNTTVDGPTFYPYDGYPDPQTMVTTEATNTYNLWLTYYNEDNMTTAAKTLIGF